MKDSIVQITIVGSIGGILLNGIMLLLLQLGIPAPRPWAVAADSFLQAPLVNTVAGTVLGLLSTVALSIATAFLILLVLNYTGDDFAILKGIIVIDAFVFATMGLFMPLLNIYPKFQVMPLTNLVAFTVMTVVGAVMAAVLAWLRTATKRKVPN
ncbi:MAG: hypothetical protein KGZ63_01690 [Clostridiales bacterium]|nr:hypothetical protein [Clostridiales bacterium]